ncbi:hypothetical protein Tco_0097167 [Tanacetum coccineum]
MDNLNITTEEYIRFEEEKACRHSKVYNWETAKYGKIWYDEDVYDLRFVETKFPAIVFNHELSFEKTLSCEPTVSSLNNNEIDFRISFHESDDEDYTVIFDKNSFSYKIIYVNDLKMDSENDNERVNMPLFPSPELKVSCFDDLDFFKDFENEFPAIVYNDALTSKSDFLTKPTLCPQHIDEFDLKNETSLSKYDEVEQNVLYFNDLFPFNIIYLDDLKSGKDNDDNKIDIIQSSGDMSPLPPRDKRRVWLRYQVEGYTKEIVHDFKQRLETIFKRQVNRVHILYFKGLTFDMRQDLAERLRMAYTRDDGQEHLWDRYSRLHTAEEMAEDGFEAYWLGSERVIPDKGDLSSYWIEIYFDRDFLRSAPSYTYIRLLVRRLCHRLISYNISRRGQAPKKVTTTDLFYLRSMEQGAANVPYLLAQYLFRHTEGRKSGARLSQGHFIGRLAYHFGPVSDDGLRGLSVLTPQGAERQPVIAAATLGGAEDAPDIDEGAQAIPAPIHAPPPPQPTIGRYMPQRLGRLEEEIQGLRQVVKSLRGLVERSMTDQGRFSTWMISCMTQLMEASGRTYQAFDRTFRGSYPEFFERCTRRRTDGAITSTAQQDEQPDP